MPDPPEAGTDADFEWVELTNVGPVALSLESFTLRDNSGAIALPRLTLPAGASIVIAGPRAQVEGSVAFRPHGGLSNGLANAGDRLALFTADGLRIDALSYGTDRAYRRADERPLPAPGPGRSLRRTFAGDGSSLTTTSISEPSPGRVETPVPEAATAVEQETSAAPPAARGTSTNRLAWAALLIVAAGALAGAAAQRLRGLRAERRR